MIFSRARLGAVRRSGPGVEIGMSTTRRNNVRSTGHGERNIVFAHGFGCDQNMWRLVAPAFERDFRTVLFDLVGAGGSDLSAYDPKRYDTLAGYATDLVEIGTELGLRDAIFVGHSVSAMIGILASIADPHLFSDLILVSPSPRYMNDGTYCGGFSNSDIDDLLSSLADNHLGWSAMMAPVIMANLERPELGEELTNSFCRTDPAIALDFARVTFTSDNRTDLAKVTARTLILQCQEDAIAPVEVGEFVRDHIAGCKMVLLKATGHCPNLSAPDEVIDAIRAFV